MAERITCCPECKNRFPDVTEVHNPETTDMNCRVTFKCDECQHAWEGLDSSPHYKEMRERGYII